MRPDLDHVSFAVHDATAWGRRLRTELGATPIAGEVLTEFRWLLMHVGTGTAGGRIELMEPRRPGFLTRVLDQHGEGPHHLTFTVPDLRAAVQQVRALDARVVGEDYGHRPWEEAFIFPDARHEVVVQLAATDRAYPDATSIVTTRHRAVDTFPSSRTATDPTWWLPVWDTEPGPAAVLTRTHLGTTDAGFSDNLFRTVLGASHVRLGSASEYQWPGGVLQVHPGKKAGLQKVEVAGNVEGLSIGRVPIGPPDRVVSDVDAAGT